MFARARKKEKSYLELSSFPIFITLFLRKADKNFLAEFGLEELSSKNTLLTRKITRNIGLK